MSQPNEAEKPDSNIRKPPQEIAKRFSGGRMSLNCFIFQSLAIDILADILADMAHDPYWERVQ